MQDTSATAEHNHPVTEEAFLSRCADPAADPDALLGDLDCLAESSGAAKADACAELWQEELVKGRRTEQLLRLLRRRAAWRTDPEFRRDCMAVLEGFFAKDLPQLAFLRNAGFNQPGLPVTEVLRRFDLLRRMRPGAVCYDKTWGVGKIQEISDYHQQVAVDFKRKPGHRLAMAHAAANLRLLPATGILARHYADPADARRMMESDPAGTVLEVLEQFGPFSVIRLQEWFVTNLLDESGWKKFWDAARKRLKDDPLVSIPTRRNEPISVRARARASDPKWLASLRAERDCEKILQVLDEIHALPDQPPEIEALTADRLAFILRAAGRREYRLRARALLAAMDWNVQFEGVDLREYAAVLLAPEVFISVLVGLPVRQQASFCQCLHKLLPETALPVLIDALRELEAGVLGEVLRALEAMGEAQRAAGRLRELLHAPNPPLELTAWLCRNPESREKYALTTADRLAFSVINLMENPAMAGVGRTRARNQLRDSLADPAWLAMALDAMDEQQRRDFALRLKNATFGADADTAGPIVQLIKLRPELEETLREPAAAVATPARLTSKRSYQERQTQLHRLITEEIPANSREIGIARDYGDLRENFEYKSAKDTQGLLMRRRMELEQMLAEVRATDFENARTDHAGPGVTVTLRHTDGTEEVYTILGEWDHHEQLGIIPCRSRLAELLQGRHVGEELDIPGADGTARRVRITAITGLTDAARAWINHAQ